MLSRLVCRRNSGANGSRKVASSGKGSGEAFGTRFLFMFPLYHKTNKVVLAGKRADVLSVLQACGADEQAYVVDLGAARQVHCRVLARRASEQQVTRRHKQQDEYARKHGTQV